jgi:PAS domain-containing protein
MIPIDTPDFKLLLETAPGLFLILKPDLTIVAASNAFLEATRTERNEIIGQGLLDVFPDNPGDVDASGNTNARASMNYVLQHRKPHKMAIQKHAIPGKNGSFIEKYWEALNTAVFTDQHKIAYIFHSLVDVTNREQEKKKLNKVERDFQLLVDSVTDYAIFMLDLNGCVAS